MQRQSRPHWSFSAINQYLRCPLQYYFQRILKIPETSIGSGLVFGSAIHSALASYHLTRKNADKFDLDQMQKEFLKAWDSKETDQSVQYKAKETKGNLQAVGIELLELYLQMPLEDEIVAVEQRYLIPLHTSEGEYLETPLLAFTDLITKQQNKLTI